MKHDDITVYTFDWHDTCGHNIEDFVPVEYFTELLAAYKELWWEKHGG